jgi:hypothetical protein
MTREQQVELCAASEHVVGQLGAHGEAITPRPVASPADAVHTIAESSYRERGSVYGVATIKNVSMVLIGGAAVAAPAIIGALLGSVIGAIAGAPLSFIAVEAVKKSAAFGALVTQLGAKLDTMSVLRKIAQSTNELKCMLRYIDFILGKAKE